MVFSIDIDPDELDKIDELKKFWANWTPPPYKPPTKEELLQEKIDEKIMIINFLKEVGKTKEANELAQALGDIYNDK